MGLYRRKGSINWWMCYTVRGRQISESTGTPDRSTAELIFGNRSGTSRAKPLRVSSSLCASGIYVVISPKAKLVKIGHSGDLEDRIRRIQTDCPDRVEVVAIIPVVKPAPVEKWLHQRFKAQRSHGEWFAIGWVDIALALQEHFGNGEVSRVG